MIILLVVLFIVLAIDFLVYRCRIRPTGSKRLQRMFWIIICGSIILPLVTAVLILLLSGNSNVAIKAVMWTVFVILFIIICRWEYYIGLLIDNHRPLSRVGLFLSATAATALIWGVTEGRQHILVNQIEINSEQLPETFDGFRIAHFSDLHIGTLVNPEREIDRMIDSIVTLRPDIIIFSGDLVNSSHTELSPEILVRLKRLTAPYGVFSVTGNHDCGHYLLDTLLLSPQEDARRVVELQREIGWRVLLDSTYYIRRGCDSISITGIAFKQELQEFSHSSKCFDIDLSSIYSELPENSFNITISHLPQLWESITSLNRGNLTLSGHIHSMQIKLRLFGRDFSPAALMYDRWSGRYDDSSGHTLYINDGIGYVGYPMRLGANPEITLYTLTR